MSLICCSQILKTHTKEVLYEKYRTEKLLARRATANITDDERQRLLEGARSLFVYQPVDIYSLPDLGL
jgi:septin family protein